MEQGKGQKGILEGMGDKVKFVPDDNGYLTVWEHPGQDEVDIKYLKKEISKLKQGVEELKAIDKNKEGRLEAQLKEKIELLGKLEWRSIFVIGAITPRIKNDPYYCAVVMKCPHTAEQERGIRGKVVAELHSQVEFLKSLHRLGNYYKNIPIHRKRSPTGDRQTNTLVKGEPSPAWMGVGKTLEGERMLEHLNEGVKAEKVPPYECLVPYREGPGFEVTDQRTRDLLDDLKKYEGQWIIPLGSKLLIDLKHYGDTEGEKIANRLVALTLAYETYRCDDVDKTIPKRVKPPDYGRYDPMAA